MPISNDLFLAILSMDAYNREYGAGVEVNGNGIGNAIFLDHEQSGISPSAYSDWQAAGFYAVAYNWNGQTVISYRGTDNPSIFENELGPSDILNGWIAGAGEPTSQTTLAIEFYEAVTQRSVFAGPAANTTVTGHSLGGGLAGLAAASAQSSPGAAAASCCPRSF